jgi:hypothetical protein
MAGRRNNSSEANIDLDNEFARGAFKKVYLGTYTKGRRKGQRCVCKVFIERDVYEESYFEHELAVSDKAMDLIQRFNDAGVITRKVFLNVPEIWTFTRTGQKNLMEPLIENFEKFNSNSGWRSHESQWHLVMQALSHFSYHSSGGNTVICDLQGGIYKDGVVLTDPVILSQHRKYGPTDLGRDGIITFFSRHRCNQFCSRSWSKPRNPVPHYPLRSGTTMELVDTRNSRPKITQQYAMSGFAAIVEESSDEFEESSDESDW